jgi:hypothetical protein
LYADMLDECYPDCEIAGMSFTTSRALKELDPTAFRCGEVDYIDSLSLVEIDGDYYEQDAVEAEREGLIEELESEVSDLEDEISELDACAEEIGEIQEKIEKLTAEIEEIKNFVF